MMEIRGFGKRLFGKKHPGSIFKEVLTVTTTKTIRHRLFRAVILAAATLCLVCLPAAADTTLPQDEAGLAKAAQAMRASNKVQFGFKGTDIVLFLRFMSEILKENLVLDPGVRGTVTVISPEPMTVAQSRQVLLSVLEINGLSIQKANGYSKVVPSGKGGSSDFNVRQDRVGPGLGDNQVTQIVPLQSVTAPFAVEACKGALPGVTVTPMSSGNKILLMGKATDVQRGVDLILAMDRPDSVRGGRTVQIVHASPSGISERLALMAKDPASPLAGLAAVADDATKQVFLFGDKRTTDQAMGFIRAMDIPARAGHFHVQPLEKADAKVVAEKLNAMLASASKLTTANGTATQPQATNVVADAATNSVLFTADDWQAQSIRELVKQLDVLPKQVFLQGLIAEVNLTKLNNAGIDWSTWGGTVDGNSVLAAQANLGGSAGVPGMFLDWFQNLSKTETTDENGNIITNYQGRSLIYGQLNLLKKHGAINVLSMPRLLCTDGSPSELQVGDVIPQLKSTLADSSNPKAVQNSYDYKDTGLILKVTPKVRSGNLVNLEVEQTVEDVLTPMTVNTPTTSKRQIKTNAVVMNGQTMILGGIIKESEKVVRQGVPILSQIPLLGELFRSASKQKDKIDLLIFLTPVIVDSPEKMQSLTQQISTTSSDISAQVSELERQLIERQGKEYKKGAVRP
jgi:general secretion pathway protein D